MSEAAKTFVLVGVCLTVVAVCEMCMYLILG